MIWCYVNRKSITLYYGFKFLLHGYESYDSLRTSAYQELRYKNPSINININKVNYFRYFFNIWQIKNFFTTGNLVNFSLTYCVKTRNYQMFFSRLEIDKELEY